MISRQNRTFIFGAALCICGAYVAGNNLKEFEQQMTLRAALLIVAGLSALWQGINKINKTID